jgi:outer membrane protein assembly factor BamB
MLDARRIDGSRSGHRLLRTLTPVIALSAALSGCWLQPGWGPSRSGHNPFEEGLTIDNVATLSRAWSVTVGNGPVLDPAVSPHGVHTVAGHFVGTNRLRDGAPLWSAQVLPPDVPGRPSHVAAPSVRNDQVLVATSLYSLPTLLEPGYGIFAYDASSGAGGTHLQVIGSDDSVTVAGDALVTTDRFLVEDDLSPVIFIGLEDLADPSRTWRAVRAVMSPGDGRTVTSAAVGDDWVVYGFNRSIEAYARAHPTICDPEDPIACYPDWVRGVAGDPTPPVLSDDGRTVFAADTGGRVWALDAADGSVRWTAVLGGQVVPQFRAAPTVGDGWLYTLSTDGRVYVFDADGCGSGTCPPVWAAAAVFNLGSKQMTLAGDVLYVVSSGAIQAYDASGCGAAVCAPLWTGFAGSSITGGPVVAFGTLLVGTADGHLIAFRPD